MKYENFAQVKSIVEQINQHTCTLNMLSSGSVSVIVNANGEQGRVMYIGMKNEKEYEYSKLAINFVEAIKDDLKHRIDYLKSMLLTL